ncbi:uncharacterized protein LOC115623483 [Scaptodrosophila lebanonensis]|uniref:Proteasome assembly chaperone 1 n=1 Tax=Drosophila lebanonensis TaxID=7225 RepID=A0A6J2TFD4_DROLE|nr:uncharacterized protein LOC115623483 [Scaptodrosophila lebanonensis]
MSCPMSFGELNIPSSRAFWDDCEEDELDSNQDPEKLDLKFQEGAQETPIPSELFVLIEGPNIEGFGNAVIKEQSSRVICDIPPKKSTSKLAFNASNKQLLAVLEDELSYSGEITELLIPYAQVAKNVFTITLKPKVEYKSEEINKYSDDITIVRGVDANLKGVIELEAPNFIVGVTAGIASWCKQSNHPCSSYIIYTDKLPLDEIAAQPVLKLLQKLGVPCSTSYTPPRKDDSHLYS